MKAISDIGLRDQAQVATNCVFRIFGGDTGNSIHAASGAVNSGSSSIGEVNSGHDSYHSLR